MACYYSASTNGFYHTHIHGDVMPEDVFEITEKKYNEMFEGQTNRQRIVANVDGGPVLQEQEPLSEELRIKEEIRQLEVTQTERRLREAIAGTDNGWLVALETQIETLRSQL